MRTTLSFVIVSSLLLAACGTAPANPITQARYADELADLLASLIILKDPVADEPGMKETLQAQIEKAKKMGDDARAEMDRGMQGQILAHKENVAGYALTLDNTLYLSSDFYSPPGLDLHAYLTTIVDPREKGAFPDDTALDLGRVKNLYGEQSYGVKKTKDPDQYRTFVLYDKKLKRIYGFAQLSRITATVQGASQ